MDQKVLGQIDHFLNFLPGNRNIRIGFAQLQPKNPQGVQDCLDILLVVIDALQLGGRGLVIKMSTK